MTTPANYPTYDRIIRDAYEDSGYIQRGDDPTPEQFASGLGRLNDLVCFEQASGLKIWLQFDQAISLVAGQALYTLMPGGDVNIAKPMRVLESGYFLDQFGISRPISMIAIGDYMLLGNKSQPGQITQYMVQKLQSQINVTFWLVPDSTVALGTAHILIQQPVSFISAVTDKMNFPQEWFLFLRWLLADDLSTGQPQAIIDRCAMKVAQYRTVIEGWDVEDASTRFTPDPQQGGYRSRFS